MPNASRRSFLNLISNSAPILLLGSTALAQTTIKRDHRPAQEKKEAEIEVTPNEDLMREHGVLRRILLLYDEVNRRLGGGKVDFDPKLITNAADIIRNFIEDYHEKLEEDYIFPRLRRAGQMQSVVSTLLEQHRVGRVLTDRIRSASSGLSDKQSRHRVQEAIAKFGRMYRPHAAWEDTVVFPALKRVVNRSEYDTLGDQFEKIERRKFGEEGFEGVLHQVQALEHALGLDDLSKFTPQP